jgi:transglutaminase-like putative cysteine protease
MKLTDTNYLSLFLFFIGICFVCSVLNTKWWISSLLKLLYIAWVLVYVYINEVVFTREALSFLIGDLFINLSALVTRDWAVVTDSFRTVLFFALLWMTTYLIHHWISIRLNIFMFFFMTVIFIAALDTFSPYEGDGAILRVMIIGLLLSGLLKVAQLFKHNGLGVPRTMLGSIVVPLLVLVAVSGTLGFLLPKAGPVWMDPVPFIQSFAVGAGSGSGGKEGMGKIGYGEDDSNLGGGFLGDNTVVFEAIGVTPQYWKIETKDTYTSRGWEQSVASNEIRNYTVGDIIDTGIAPGPPENQQVAEISISLTYPFLMYPYGTVAAQAVQGTTFSISNNTQKIETFQQNDSVKLPAYSLSFSEPEYSLTALRATNVESLNGLSSEFNRYLQLPENFPDRIRELAVKITGEHRSLYEKARAIERYFPKNGYIYDQRNVAVPEDNQDYVDQFLFETQRGYCDNFSTSMVVMLRSLGIPARWVKGFAEGEELRKQDGKQVFQITNNNAHSWVEAYFPEIGWMPFEPTIGFTGAGNIDFDLESTSEDKLEPVVPKTPEKPDVKTVTKEKSISERFTDMVQSFATWISDNKVRIFYWSIIVIALGTILFRIRKKWMPKILVPFYRLRKEDWKSFEQGYHRLLKQLALYGIERREGQTLGTYSKYVDSFFGSADMKTLTKAYEKGFYGGKIESHEWGQLRESWENLINHTSG